MLHWVLIIMVQDHGATLITHDFVRESACRQAEAQIVSLLDKENERGQGIGYSSECIADGFAPEHDFSNVTSGVDTSQ